jgi:hypothetical protein
MSRRTPQGEQAVKLLRQTLLPMDPELAAATAAVDAEPTNARALQRRSDLYLVRGRKVEALVDLRAAVALDASRPVGTAAESRRRRVCWWAMWHLYTALLVVIGSTVIISALLATLTELAGLVPSPLHNAAERGDQAAVSRIVGTSVGPGSPAILGVPLGQHLLWQAPLGVAAFKDHVTIVVALLDAGAAPDVGRAEGPLGWISTETPIYTVRSTMWLWSQKAVSLVLSHSACCCVFDASILQAAQLGHAAVVRALLTARNRRGADANEGLSAGPLGLLATESPLAAAAARGHTATVVALLEGGADPNLGWSLGHGLGATSSPLALAVDREHTAIIHELLDHGASPDMGRKIGPGAPIVCVAPSFSMVAT